jgi:hypothetical protein
VAREPIASFVSSFGFRRVSGTPLRTPGRSFCPGSRTSSLRYKFIMERARDADDLDV